ncbi:MAG: hypothetical protein HYS81_04870 [Candidatus Aenigmatarchaeota archaeon]|nr:MAG: hypothetical protein HYS81_04870 [Candidatus Aenigmarchaeota archaeon]
MGSRSRSHDREPNEETISELGGVFSSLLRPIIQLLKQYARRYGLTLTQEFWLLALFFLYVLVNTVVPISTIALIALGVGILLNLLVSNPHLLRRTRNIEYIMNDQRVDINRLDKFLEDGAEHLTADDLDFIIKNASDNARIYHSIFKHKILKESEIQYLLDRRFLLKSFCNDTLVKRFIKKCSSNIGFSTYTKMLKQLKTRKTNPAVFSQFLTKYYEYSHGVVGERKIAAIRFVNEFFRALYTLIQYALKVSLILFVVLSVMAIVTPTKVSAVTDAFMSWIVFLVFSIVLMETVRVGFFKVAHLAVLQDAKRELK